MHYYQFNIADYQSHTKHLTPIEDICYRRLLDWQYMHEKPIPVDINGICRVLMLREYLTDVEQILKEFFSLTDLGWINNRAFEEIETFQAHDEENRLRDENEKDRKKKHRDERNKLFAELKNVAIVPEWNISMSELRTVHKQHIKVTEESHDNTCDESVTSHKRPRDESVTAITNNQEPLTNNHKPRTINQEPLTKNQKDLHSTSVSEETSVLLSDGVENLTPPAQKIKSLPKKQNADLSPSHETWQSYSDAYEKRYGVTPVRNATINAQLSSFIKRIGFEESPHVAAFYVYHNNQFYVTKMHTVGLLLADAEKLRTEWATKTTVTQTQARQADKTQARGNVFNKLIEEARANATQ